MLHWFNQDIWGPIWPNLAASLIVFVAGTVWARRKLLAKWEEQERAHLQRHGDLKEILSQQPSAGDAGSAPTTSEGE